MKRTPSETQFILITLLLVLLLGAHAGYSLMKDEMAEPRLASEIENSGTASLREPASLPTSRPVLGQNLSKFLDVDLSCKKIKDPAYQISGNAVQFKGRNCLKNFVQEKIEIVNRSNGYTASVFPYGENQYQTDLIQLVDGENEIIIRYASPSGPRYERTIKVRSSAI